MKQPVFSHTLTKRGSLSIGCVDMTSFLSIPFSAPYDFSLIPLKLAKKRYWVAALQSMLTTYI